MLVVGAASLGATVFSGRLVQAAEKFVEVTIAGPLDDQGNVNVHERGTVVIRDPEAAREPWHLDLGPSGSYVVPAGKRLVIEYVNAVTAGAIEPEWQLVLADAVDGQAYQLHGTSLANCVNCYTLNESLRLYATAGKTVYLGPTPAGTPLRLSGYLIDVP
jgi:hypothetical protein